MLKQLGLMFLAASLAAVAFSSSMNGTWKVNTDRSKYMDRKPPKSSIVTVSEDATKHHLHFYWVSDDNKPFTVDLSFPLNGGPVEFTATQSEPLDSSIDHAVVEVVSPNKWIFSYFSKDNKLTSTRVVTRTGNETEARYFMKTPHGDKLIEDEVTELQ